MAGHSHWARIKRAKAVTDARRGRAWGRLSRAIIVAARGGGGDPESNLALRYAIDAARAENMPRDTIERAIKKGTGDLEGAQYEELTYEGYGPGGASFLCQALTDNRTRTAGEIKNLCEHNNGNLAAPGAVARLFTKRGLFIIAATAATEDRLMELALEIGADDVRFVDEAFELSCDPGLFGAVRDALAAAKIATESAELTMVPSMTVPLTGEAAEKMMKLVQALEDQDDVQNVYSNADISAEDMDKYAK